MPTPSVLEALNWPDPAKLGVVQWALTDDESLSSTVATLQRTDDAIRARVVVRTFEGEQRSLFCAVWADAPTGSTLTHHKLHEQDQALDDARAIATFQDYVNTIGQRPRFTYAGDAAREVSGATAVADASATGNAPRIPRTPRF